MQYKWYVWGQCEYTLCILVQIEKYITSNTVIGMNDFTIGTTFNEFKKMLKRQIINEKLGRAEIKYSLMIVID
jgi:hypothetical protein